MANENITGLMSDLGLGPIDEGSAFQRAQQARLGPQQRGQFGGAFSAGQQMGRGGQSLVQGLAGGIGGLITGEGGRSFGEFKRDFQAARDDHRDRLVAEGLGTDVDTLKRQREMRKQLSALNFPSTGDVFKDQDAALQKIIDVANQTGDTQTLSKAMAKRQQLRSEEAAIKKVEGSNVQDALTTDIMKTDFAQGLSTGIPILLPGQNPNDLIKNGGFSTSAYRKETDDFEVTAPDGTTTIQDTIVPLDPRFTPGSAGRNRVSEEPFREAIAISGGGKAYRAKQVGLDNMIENGESVEAVLDILLSFPNPQDVLKQSGDFAIGADNFIRFLESSEDALRGTGAKDGSYIDKISGAKISAGQYTWGGKVVPQAAQKSLFMKATDIFLTEDKLVGILPDHLAKVIRDRGEGAAKLRALIMEMAYMDARIQEPSNRGLSDKDIEAAIARIGIASANPAVFIETQIRKTKQMQNRLNRLGEEYFDTSTNTAQQITDATWSQKSVERARESVTGQLLKLEDSLAEVRRRQAERDNTADLLPPGDEAPLVNEDFEAQRNRLLGIEPDKAPESGNL